VVQNVVAALLPVVAFLALLFLMDSFKLVPHREVIAALAAGAAAALAALALHSWLLPESGLSVRAFSRYVAPVTEETLKAVYVVLVLKRGRIGFMVDAALVGFTVGTGFALVENAEYLRSAGDSRFVVWIVRGFGPAVLHGAATALFAILAKSLSDLRGGAGMAALAPGWAAAIVLHGTFNHFPLPPVLATCTLLLVLPLLVTAVFNRSERATRAWVGQGLDVDVELLNLVTSTDFGKTRIGAYLRQLTSRFPGPVVADMFCLLRLDIELGIRARGLLIAREAGLQMPMDPDLKAKLQEIRYLERSIGKTGLIALRPLRAKTDRDDWDRYLLEQTGHGATLGRGGRLRRWLPRPGRKDSR
jgi:RsiW-degrading membrane proteinase PrsW (M82 family)